MPDTADLVVAVTGATGTVGAGVVAALEADDRIARVIGVTRTPFDPADRGWTRTESRQADVRDPEALAAAFAGADVVVHLAFMTTGTASRETTRSINVDGTRNAIRATSDAGAAPLPSGPRPSPRTAFTPTTPYRSRRTGRRGRRRTSSTRARRRSSRRCSPTRPRRPASSSTSCARPSCSGPTPSARSFRGRSAPSRTAYSTRWGAPRSRSPSRRPSSRSEIVHQADLGTAVARCVTADGPPGAYNVAADGALTGVEVVRELGLTPIPIPAGATQAWRPGRHEPPLAAAGGEWLEACTHPAIMDTAKAKRELGWSPRDSGIEVLRETLAR